MYLKEQIQNLRFLSFSVTIIFVTCGSAHFWAKIAYEHVVQTLKLKSNNFVMNMDRALKF